MHRLPEVRLCKKCLLPEEPSHLGNRIGKGGFGFLVTRSMAEARLMTLEVFVVNPADDGEQ